MSAHGHADAHGVDDHDDHDAHDHAPPPPPEPETPLWFTMFGIGLFLCAALWFVATRESGKTTAELTATSAAPAPSAAPTPAPN